MRRPCPTSSMQKYGVRYLQFILKKRKTSTTCGTGTRYMYKHHLQLDVLFSQSSLFFYFKIKNNIFIYIYIYISMYKRSWVDTYIYLIYINCFYIYMLQIIKIFRKVRLLKVVMDGIFLRLNARKKVVEKNCPFSQKAKQI